jgi:hypothetical protein
MCFPVENASTFRHYHTDEKCVDKFSDQRNQYFSHRNLISHANCVAIRCEWSVVGVVGFSNTIWNSEHSPEQQNHFICKRITYLSHRRGWHSTLFWPTNANTTIPSVFSRILNSAYFTKIRLHYVSLILQNYKYTSSSPDAYILIIQSTS